MLPDTVLSLVSQEEGRHLGSGFHSSPLTGEVSTQDTLKGFRIWLVMKLGQMEAGSQHKPHRSRRHPETSSPPSELGPLSILAMRQCLPKLYMRRVTSSIDTYAMCVNSQ